MFFSLWGNIAINNIHELGVLLELEDSFSPKYNVDGLFLSDKKLFMAYTQDNNQHYHQLILL